MHTPVTSASVKSPWRIARGRFLLALAAFALMLIATLSLVGHRASAAELRAPGTQSAIAEQTEDTEDNPPAPAPVWSIFDRLHALGLLPEQAVQMMRRAMLEHVEALHPGRACERILQAGQAAPTVFERCRAALADPLPDSSLEPAEVCRRALQAPTAVQSLIERCRAWAGSTSPDRAPSHSPAEACRRVAAADAPVDELIERCRAWLADQAGSDAPTAGQLCVRILAADAAPEALVERCEALAGSSRDVERPARTERPGRR